MNSSQEIAKLIKVQATTQKINVSQMLTEIGLGKSTLSNLENGSMLKADSLGKIADYLDVSVDYLLGRTDNSNSCSSVRNTDTTISGTQINGNRINATPSDSSLAEIEIIISKLPNASKHRAIADMLDVLEKYT